MNNLSFSSETVTTITCNECGRTFADMEEAKGHNCHAEFCRNAVGRIWRDGDSIFRVRSVDSATKTVIVDFFVKDGRVFPSRDPRYLSYHTLFQYCMDVEEIGLEGAAEIVSEWWLDGVDRTMRILGSGSR